MFWYMTVKQQLGMEQEYVLLMPFTILDRCMSVDELLLLLQPLESRKTVITARFGVRHHSN